MRQPCCLHFAVFLMTGSFPIRANAAQTTQTEFIKGMDLSSLEAVEDYGGVFYDENNNPIPNILAYVKSKGVNYIRLRIWNDPTLAFDAGDYCNKEHTIEMAQRIKAAGLKLLLDFHYSDFWADPAHQQKPAAWENLTFPQLVQAVYDYTADVLNDLDVVGAYPDMVQIGNEISGGLLWPDGYIDNPQNLAALLNSGIQAVRDTTPSGKTCKIMIHIAEGGDTERFEYFFDLLTSHGVTDFDVIGLSYYAYWHGTLQDAKNNMNNCVSRYGKEVCIVETAYPYTYADADGYPNAVGQKETDIGGLPASVFNQKLMLEMTFNTVATVNNNKGLGVFYWEPLWLPVPGAGVMKGEGNEWDNQIMFDANGKVLDSINAFQFDPAAAAQYNDRHTIVYSPEPIKVQVDTYNSLNEVLPQTVKVLRFDGTLVDLPVTWIGADQVDMSKVATVTLNGVVSGLNPYPGVQLATPQITVKIQRNLVKNPSFEIVSGNTYWTINKILGDAGQITNGVHSTPKSGIGSFHYWDDKDFIVEVTQDVYVTENHTYTLNVWAQGSWANMDYDNYYLFARYTAPNGQQVLLGRTDMMNANWGWWNEFSVENIVIPAGVNKITIGAHIRGHAGAYGTLDDFELLDNDPNAPPPPEGDIVTSLVNGDFEDEVNANPPYASMTGWTITPNNGIWPNKCWADTDHNHTAGGKYSFHYYDPNPFGFTLSQTLTGLEPGTYMLTVWSYGSADGKTALLYANSSASNVSTPIIDTNQWDSSTNSPVWVKTTLTGIVVTNGNLTIGVDVTGLGGSWGFIDDFVLVKVS